MKDLLSLIREKNIKLRVTDGDLSVKFPKGQIDDGLLDRIKLNKQNLILFLINQSQTGELAQILNIKPQISYGLSSAQLRLWISSQWEDANTAYNIPGVYVLQGKLNALALESSFNTLIKRHEILRTVFREDESNEVKQFVLSEDAIQFKIGFKDLKSHEDQDEIIKIAVKAEYNKPFDLSQGPLLRACLYEVSADKWIFTYVMHHIISDGWSMQIILKELLLIYNATIKCEEYILAPLHIHYKDYSAWQQQGISTTNIHKSYWLNQFAGDLPVLQIPVDKVRPLIKTYNGKTIIRQLNFRTTKGVKALVKEQECTLFMGILAMVNAFLFRYTSQEDIIIGTPIAGREHFQLDQQIGCYVNTLPLRLQFNGNDNFIELCGKVKQVTLEAYEHQLYPFDDLINSLSISRDISRSPLFDIMVVLENEPQAVKFEIDELKVSHYPMEANHSSKFDLLFSFIDTGDEIDLHLQYNTDVFSENLINQYLNHLVALIQSIIQYPNTPINELEFLTSKERTTILKEYNNTSTIYPRDKDLAQVFEEQVHKTPDNIALVHGNNKLTYKELNQKADRASSYLKQVYGVQTGDRISLIFERSEAFVVSLLAVLKAGATYVPIDHSYPIERIRFILDDTCSFAVICDKESVLAKIENPGIHTISVEEIEMSPEECLNQEGVTNGSFNEVAYVMYTSGSSGTPKGVMIPHKGVLRLVINTNYTSLDFNSRLLLAGSISFDASTFEIWGMLLNGGVLVLASGDELTDPFCLKETMYKNEVNIMWFSSSWFNHLVDIDIAIFSRLKSILVGGDKLSYIHINKVRNIYPDVKIINGYGPTENTTFSVCYNISNTHLDSIPIGYPISNSGVYILDRNFKVVPWLVSGEIYLSGDGLSSGYLNNQELTNDKFLQNPYNRKEIIYYTGDIGCWLEDGSIQFLGRKDDQVKIRGFRIEPGEIENTILKLNIVESAIVLVRSNEKSQEKYLVAYILSKNAEDIGNVKLKLSECLPAHMIPAAIIRLEKFPLTVNGKIDKKALLFFENSEILETEYIQPETVIEKKLAKIFEGVLESSSLGMGDNFFECGGQSLKAMKLVSRIHKEFAVRVGLKDIFERPTISGLADLIAQKKPLAYASIPALRPSAYYELSNAQKRLWVLSQFEGGSAAYNIPRAFMIEGDLDKPSFRRAFETIIARHESLRTVFVEIDGDPKQQVIDYREGSFLIPERDISMAESQDELVRELITKESQTAFELERGPLLRLELVQLGASRQLVLFTMHHIISDGWSMEVFDRELLTLYEAYSQNKESPLPALSIQYKDYASWLNDQIAGDGMKEDEAYWLNEFKDEIPVLELPLDKPRPLVKTYQGSKLEFSLSLSDTFKLKQYCEVHEHTLYTLFLGTVNTLLFKYTGQTDIVIGAPVAGREHIDLENQIGFYVNTLALRSKFNSGDTFADLLKKVRVVVVGGLEHQKYPFDVLVEKLNLSRDTTRSALFDVMVALNNNSKLTEETQLEGLKIERVVSEVTVSKFDLGFIINEGDDAFEIEVQYNTDLFERGRIERLTDHFQNLISSILSESNTSLSEIEILTAAEHNQMLYEFNDKKVDYPKDKTVIYGDEIRNDSIEFLGAEIEQNIGKTGLVLKSGTNDKYIDSLFQIEQDIQGKLLSIWGSILEHEDIKLNDDFFKIGGNSLKALKLIFKINKEFNTDILITDIFNRTSIKALTVFIKEKLSKKLSESNIVHFNSQEGHPENQNIYLVHDGSGEVNGYSNFCNRLQENYNFYGLRFIRSEKKSPEEVDIKDLAKTYVAQLKQIQPVGPYILAGWSLGGIIAFEMTSLLETYGETVDSLALFDSPFPSESLTTATFSINEEFKVLDLFFPTLTYSNEFDRVHNVKDFWEVALGLIKDQYDLFHVKKLFLEYKEMIPTYDEIQSMEDLFAQLNLLRSLKNAMTNYFPAQKIQANIEFFSAVDSTVDVNKYQLWCSKQINLHRVNGNHYTMFNEPNVVLLAETFSNIYKSGTHFNNYD